MNWRGQFRYDPDIGFTFIPGLKLRIPHERGGYLIQTNSLGFRDAREPSAYDGPKRVFVFGDSFTAGDGVSNGMRYSDELEKLLGAVEVYNFGLPNTGTDQQFIAYSKFAGELRCDLLIVAVLIENIRRNTSYYRPIQKNNGELFFQAKPYFDLVNGVLQRGHDPVPEQFVTPADLQLADKFEKADLGGRFSGLRKLVINLGLKEVVQRLTAYQPVPDYDEESSYGWQLMQAILKKWRKVHKGAMLVVPLPLYQHVEGTAGASAYQSRFAELASGSGISVFDVLPDLHAYEPKIRRSFRFRKDVHLTPEGHKAVARSLFPIVSSLLDKAEREF